MKRSSSDCLSFIYVHSFLAPFPVPIVCTLEGTHLLDSLSLSFALLQAQFLFIHCTFCFQCTKHRSWYLDSLVPLRLRAVCECKTFCKVFKVSSVLNRRVFQNRTVDASIDGSILENPSIPLPRTTLTSKGFFPPPVSCSQLVFSQLSFSPSPFFQLRPHCNYLTLYLSASRSIFYLSVSHPPISQSPRLSSPPSLRLSISSQVVATMDFFKSFGDVRSNASSLAAKAASTALHTAAAAADAVALDAHVGIGTAIALTVVAGIFRGVASSTTTSPVFSAAGSASAAECQVIEEESVSVATTGPAASFCACSSSAAVGVINRTAGFNPRDLEAQGPLVRCCIRHAAWPPTVPTDTTVVYHPVLDGDAVLQSPAPAGINCSQRCTTLSGCGGEGAPGGDDSDTGLEHRLSNVS